MKATTDENQNQKTNTNMNRMKSELKLITKENFNRFFFLIHSFVRSVNDLPILLEFGILKLDEDGATVRETSGAAK